MSLPRWEALPPWLAGTGLAVGLLGAATEAVDAPFLAALLGLAVALALLLAGSRGHPAGAYAVVALRVALAVALLMGLVLLRSGFVPAQALGVLWLAGALAVALGVLTPWSGLYAALVLPLALPLGGTWAVGGLALAALGLAFTDDPRLAVDAWLRRRGGVFPAVRREVVLEARR